MRGWGRLWDRPCCPVSLRKPWPQGVLTVKTRSRPVNHTDEPGGLLLGPIQETSMRRARVKPRETFVSLHLPRGLPTKGPRKSSGGGGFLLAQATAASGQPPHLLGSAGAQDGKAPLQTPDPALQRHPQATSPAPGDSRGLCQALSRALVCTWWPWAGAPLHRPRDMGEWVRPPQSQSCGFFPRG